MTEKRLTFDDHGWHAPMPRIVQRLLIAFDLVLMVRVLNGRFHIGQVKLGLGRGVFEMVTLVPIFCTAPDKR